MSHDGLNHLEVSFHFAEPRRERMPEMMLSLSLMVRFLLMYQREFSPSWHLIHMMNRAIEAVLNNTKRQKRAITVEVTALCG
jgi:hypothetical protein